MAIEPTELPLHKRGENSFKADDLMLNNLVLNAGGQIISVTPQTISDFNNKMVILNPIRISVDILSALEFFIRSDNSILYALLGENTYTKDYAVVLVNTGTFWFYKNGMHRIDYVHELQNLYSILYKQPLDTNKLLFLWQKNLISVN